jgi:predicted DNA-binding transcriptional regulator YafY
MFQIVNLLRSRKQISAQALADELEVSVRTIYRYIDDLSTSGVPVYGEPGIGYRLLDGFELPPLTLTDDEGEALVVGARMLAAWAGSDLKQAAQSLLHKIESAVPEQQKLRWQSRLYVPADFMHADEVSHLQQLRDCIRHSHKARLSYQREDGTFSRRVVHPLALFYWGNKWTLGAWCELRTGFRDFRIDRIHTLEPLPDIFDAEGSHGIAAYLDAVGRVVPAR